MVLKPIDVKFDLRKSYARDPTQGNTCASGYDIITPVILREVELPHGTLITLGTGLAIKPMGDDIYFDLVPRSSFSMLGIVFCNSIGILDSDYRGEISAVVLVYKGFDKTKLLSKALFQLIPRTKVPINFIKDKIHVDTERGTGGYGSTDKLPDLFEIHSQDLLNILEEVARNRVWEEFDSIEKEVTLGEEVKDVKIGEGHYSKLPELFPDINPAVLWGILNSCIDVPLVRLDLELFSQRILKYKERLNGVGTEEFNNKTQ